MVSYVQQQSAAIFTPQRAVRRGSDWDALLPAQFSSYGPSSFIGMAHHTGRMETQGDEYS